MGVLNSETKVKDVTASFIHDKFRNDSTGEFDEAKAQSFADELQLRRKELQQQVHDTRYSERILRDVLSHRDALKNAHKKSTFGSVSNALCDACLESADRILTFLLCLPIIGQRSERNGRGRASSSQQNCTNDSRRKARR